MEEPKQDSKIDINRVKYYLSVKRYGRACLEEAFYLLYNTWARGRSYATLQKFCVECLGVRREQLADVLCQPEVLSPQSSARSSTTYSSSAHEARRRASQEERRSMRDACHFYSPLSFHVISSGRRSERRIRNEEVNMLQDVTDAADPQRKRSFIEEQDNSEHMDFHLSEGETHDHTRVALTEPSCCMGLCAPQREDKCAEEPRASNVSQLWDRVRRLLLVKPSVNKKLGSDMSLRRESVDPTAPSRQPSSPPTPPAAAAAAARYKQTKPQTVSEDLKSLERRESQDLTDVIQEAKKKLQCSLSLHEHGRESCCLYAEPDPSQMPLSVLISLLTKVFPEITTKIHHLVNRLQRLVYVVCYEDLVFDDHQLKFRQQKLSTIISEIIAAVVSSCTAVTQRSITETTEKLLASKQQLRNAQSEYDSHLHWVEKTREELEVVQKELKTAQVKNFRVLRAYSRSCSQESDDLHKVTTARGETEPCHYLDNGDANIKSDIINRTDSGNISLDEELESLDEELESQGGRTEQREDCDDCYSDSLLVSVMREVALIEKKHNSFSSFDRKLKMMVRDTHKSVILTKREMRERLNSNVSAEEGAMSKEEVLSRRQMKTRMLSKDVRKLRRNLKDLRKDEKAIVSRFNKDLEALMEYEMDEATQLEGRRGVQHLREGSGQLLRESRCEAKSFAARVRIPDLAEWLMKQQYATTPVRQVYSRVRIPDKSHTIHITDLVGTGEQHPPIIVLSGPKGSGKTCMSHYLLQQWEANTEAIKSNIHEFDLVVYGTVSSVLSSGSWAQYLREHIFCVALKEFAEAEVYGALSAMSILFLLDVDTDTTSVIKILDDVFGHLGSNQVVVTTRPDGVGAIVETAKRQSVRCQRVRMCPMTSSTIREYSTRLVSLFEQDESTISNTVKQFLRLVSSMKATEQLLYPLFMTYLLYLWRANPRHALQATTVSRLVSQVIIVAESTLVEALRAASKHDRKAAQAKAEQCTEQLCGAAWELVSRQEWPHDGHFVLESESISLTNPFEINAFTPLITTKESADGKLRASFLHPAVAEILCGFFLTQQKLLPKGTPLLRHREKLEKYCVPEVKRYKEVLPHAAGALVYNKHKPEDANEIAAVFFNSLTDKRDMIAWRTLLRECDFLSTMCAAVSSVLSCYDLWTVSRHSQEVNCALSDLLKREAYRPQTVIVSQEGEFGCKSKCVIRALATCSSTMVHVRQESQFYTWGEPATSDALIVPLQPPGTLQECWGHVGVEGALALRHCHQLKELNIRVSSCQALGALAYSLEHIGSSLRYLYLRLDLPTSTPVSDIESLNFKGRSLWLRLRGVEDANLNWVKEVTGKLSDWYTEVLLEKSHLSPSALHELKHCLPNTPVHISY